eukprot:529275_1
MSYSDNLLILSVIIAIVAVGFSAWMLLHYFKKNRNKNNNNNNNKNENETNKSITTSPPPQTPHNTKETEHITQTKATSTSSPTKSASFKPKTRISVFKTTKTTIQCHPDEPPITITSTTTQHIDIPKSSIPNWSPFIQGLTYGLIEEQGLRPQMENCAKIMDMIQKNGENIKKYSFSLFDGHLGQDAAKFCTHHLPQYVEEIINQKQQEQHTTVITEESIITESIRAAFHKTDKEFKHYAFTNKCEAGAVGVYIYYDSSFMYVANVGDCQAVLCSDGEYKILTKEHNVTKNDDERTRCKQYIINDRINGELSITRAIGDYHECNNNSNPPQKEGNNGNNYKHKKVDGLICEPHIIKHKLSSKDEFVIIACDGLWDVLTPKHAMKECRRSLRHNADCTVAAKKLVDLATKKLTTDNVSVMVIGFANKDSESGKLHIGPKLELLRRPSRLRFRKRASSSTKKK